MIFFNLCVKCSDPHPYTCYTESQKFFKLWLLIPYPLFNPKSKLLYPQTFRPGPSNFQTRPPIRYLHPESKLLHHLTFRLDPLPPIYTQSRNFCTQSNFQTRPPTPYIIADFLCLNVKFSCTYWHPQWTVHVWHTQPVHTTWKLVSRNINPSPLDSIDTLPHISISGQLLLVNLLVTKPLY